MPYFRLLGFLLLSSSWAWSFTPIHRQVAESPLLYLRCPILWDRPELSDLQQDKLAMVLLESLTKPGKTGHAMRELVGSLKGQFEFIALPPENRFLPMPGLALRVGFKGSQEEIAKKIQSLIIVMVEEFQGSPADWLKFKRTVEGDVITDTAFLLGRVTLVVEKNQFTLYFSQSNPAFLKTFEAQSKVDIEADQAAKNNDFFLHADVEKSLSFYKEWMQRVDPSMLNDLTKWGLVDFKHITLWTEGESESFQLKALAELTDDLESNWSLLSGAQKASAQFPDSGDFKGSMLWPKLNSTQWLKVFDLLGTIAPAQKNNYAELFQMISGPIAFAWQQKSIAPIISIELTEAKNFESSLSKAIAPTAKITKEAGSDLRHVLWGANSVSYKIEGNRLTFSPLLQALRDLKTGGEKMEQSDLIQIVYPLEGRVSGNYYTLMHLVLQSVVNSGKAMDPKAFPAFSGLNLSDRTWNGKGVFELSRSKQILKMNWKQPFGLSGLVSGVKLPSFNWVYFLSLASLTAKSVD